MVFTTQDLHLPVEVLSKCGREQPDLVGRLPLAGDVIHLGLRLEFGEEVFLGAASVMKDQQLSGGDRLIGHDDL